MFKIDKVKTLFDCSLCNQLIVDPVMIPCGYSICKKHLTNEVLVEGSEKLFKCGICQVEHVVPKEGIVINRFIQNALDIKFNTLKLNPVYEECKKVIVEAQSNLAQIEVLDKDPEFFIYNYFEDIKIKVDLRREELKLRIDNSSDDIIQSIEKTKASCVELSETVDKLTGEIENSKQELNKLVERFDTFDIDDKRDIMNSVIIFNKRLARMAGIHKASLIGNEDFSFEFKEVQIDDVFGCFKATDKAFESKIMESYLQRKLIELCEFPKDNKWELKYRGTRDGLEAADFHSRCDGFANTLTVVKSTIGNIFGGYTEQAWHSKGAFMTDPKAFIFSLVNKEEDPFKAVVEGTYAIAGFAKCGPIFGGYFGDKACKDLIILPNEKKGYSYSYFGYSYQHERYPKDTVKANSILAGSHASKIQEIEVFVKKI